MKLAVAGLAMAAAVFACASASAAEIHEGGMTGPEVAAWLKGQGYKAELTKDDNGDPWIRSTLDGLNFNVFFYDCEAHQRCRAIQFSAGFDLETPLTASKINEWNRGQRYLKAYVDDEGDPYVQYDVNVNAGRTTSGLDDDFSVWTGMLGDFASFIGWR